MLLRVYAEAIPGKKGALRSGERNRVRSEAVCRQTGCSCGGKKLQKQSVTERQRIIGIAPLNAP
jgi:hypothetical protein